MIKTITDAGRRLRACIAFILSVSLAVSPAASAQGLKPAIDLPGAGAAARSSVGAIMERIESGNVASSVALPAIRSELSRPDAMRPHYRPITLAQLEDQLRRPDVQASIGKGSIAVLYPNVEAPFRSAFTSIIQGIEERTRLRVRSYPVDPKVDTAELNSTLRHNNTRVVIALGRQGLNATAGLDREITVLAGGVLLLSDAENVAGISLTPDPALLFSRLRALLPDLRRVIVVYDPQKSDWLIRLARDAARAQGLELQAHVANELGKAAQLYPQLFASADNRRDAVWLPHDSTTVEESIILPMVLRESWNSGVPLFSSNVLHVKKGALFAMGPNNVELGRALASSAMGVINGDGKRRGLTPLRDLQTAINVRTANHMGLNLSSQHRFDYVYPQP